MATTEKKLAEVKVELWDKNPHLCEIYQVTGFEYAFVAEVNGTLKQCHQWIKCRDFLHDALLSHVSGKKNQIYGFAYDPKHNVPLDLSKMRVLIRRNKERKEEKASETTREMMKAARAGLNCVEKEGKMKPLSKLYRLEGYPDYYMFEGSADWMDSTFMISLYTFLIRLGARQLVFKGKKEFDEKLKELCKCTDGDHDISYLKTVIDYIYKIVDKREDLKYKKDAPLFGNRGIDTFHNYTGIVSLCNEAKKLQNKQKAGGGLEDLTKLAAHIC